MNQKFGTKVVGKDLGIAYKPGSELSRQLIGYSNIYWAKKLAGAANGKSVAVITTEPVNFSAVKGMGGISRSGKVMSEKARQEARNNECVICINPGGEETWDKLVSAHSTPSSSFVVLNNAYSTSYDLGNKRGYEEAYYLKRISKGWVYRAFPGKWEAYIEKPDGAVELLQSYDTKPLLRDVSALVRDEVRANIPILYTLEVYLFLQLHSFISHSKDTLSITIDGHRDSVGDFKRSGCK